MEADREKLLTDIKGLKSSNLNNMEDIYFPELEEEINSIIEKSKKAYGQLYKVTIFTESKDDDNALKKWVNISPDPLKLTTAIQKLFGISFAQIRSYNDKAFRGGIIISILIDLKIFERISKLEKVEVDDKTYRMEINSFEETKIIFKDFPRNFEAHKIQILELVLKKSTKIDFKLVEEINSRTKLPSRRVIAIFKTSPIELVGKKKIQGITIVTRNNNKKKQSKIQKKEPTYAKLAGKKEEKTKICFNYQANHTCRFGDKCHFKHIDEPEETDPPKKILTPPPKIEQKNDSVVVKVGENQETSRNVINSNTSVTQANSTSKETTKPNENNPPAPAKSEAKKQETTTPRPEATATAKADRRTDPPKPKPGTVESSNESSSDEKVKEKDKKKAKSPQNSKSNNKKIKD